MDTTAARLLSDGPLVLPPPLNPIFEDVNVVFTFKLDRERTADQWWHAAVFASAHPDTWTFTSTVNFSVFRRGKLTFTVFDTGGHVNASGTRGFARMSRSLAAANLLFGLNLRREDVRVVSSTWSGRFPDRPFVDVPTVWRRAVRLASRGPARWRVRPFYVSLRPSIFPAAVIRRATHPTLLLFANGKFVVVGARSPAAASYCVSTVARHLLAPPWADASSLRARTIATRTDAARKTISTAVREVRQARR
jgi:hypothetical protein